MFMLFVPGCQQPDNPWKEKVPAAVERAERDHSVAAFREALDTTWRADDWQAGLKLAEQALKKKTLAQELQPRIIRALWRAGRLLQAEELASDLPTPTDDRVALRVLIEIHLARGQLERALELAAHLETLPTLTAEDLYHVFAARFTGDRLDGLADLLRRAERLTDPRHGYPETFVGEAIDGVAEFLSSVGNTPLNQIVQHGAAPMPPLVMFNLPSCDVLINGRGPYRMVVDTGGSIMVALDQTVADEIGIKSIAKASVRGVAGKTESGQALIDELQIGNIRCRRVLTRVFDVRAAIMNAADGVIGTGVFGRARLTLDFASGQLLLSPSTEAEPAGRPAELRLISDAKLIVPVKLQGQPALALLDTGADAVALSPTRLKLLFPDQELPSIRSGLALGVGSGESPSVSLGPGVNLELAGRKFSNYGGLGLNVLDEVLSPALGVQLDILLGMPTFREMRSCTVDFARCRLWIDWLREE